MIFAAIWKIYQPIAAVLVPVLLFALIGLWISKGIEIHGLTGDNNSLIMQIDDPNTGFRAQIARLNNNLATSHQNESTLQMAIQKQNQDVMSWESAAKLAQDQTKKAIAEIAKRDAAATIILNTKSQGDACTSAFNLIHEANLP